MTENQINSSTSIFFSNGKFWQKSYIFINLILIYCKIKEEEASEEITLRYESILYSQPSLCTYL